MGLADFSLKKPVTILMIFAGIILLGFISWAKLPQELFPPITYPQISVVTYYKDAAPEEIEVLVTKPIEEAVGTVGGLKRVSSTSKEEVSLVIAEFDWGINVDMASLNVREKIDLVKEKLPRGSSEPIVVKFNPFELPVIVLNVTGRRPPQEMLVLCKKIIKNELEKIDGVASCDISGGIEKIVAVEVDQAKLLGADLSILDISEALRKANLNYPAGTIEEKSYEKLIRTVGEFENVEEIAELPIYLKQYDQSQPERAALLEGKIVSRRQPLSTERFVPLKEIARVKEEPQEKESISRYNGNDNISVSIRKKAGANTVKVARLIKAKIRQISKEFPGQVNIDIAYDQSKFIVDSINGVRDAAAQGGFLAFLVLLFFLRDFRSSLVVAITIPVSIMVTVSLMYFRGMTLNMISLGGIALGVGMLVDTSIVVIENITRYRQLGKDLKTSCVIGTEEVTAAITSSTLTTVVVFLPMIFVVGIAGQIFKELAFCVVFALSASLIVALTLIPLLVFAVGKVETAIKEEYPILIKLKESYNIYLGRFLENRKKGLRQIFAAFIVSVLILLFFVNKEFLPVIDQGQFIIKVETLPGATLDKTDSAVRIIEADLLKIKDVKDVTVNVGSAKKKTAAEIIQALAPHQGMIIVNLKQRRRRTQDVIQDLKRQLAKEDLAGAEVEYVLQESILKSAFVSGAPLMLEIKGQNIDTLRQLTEMTKQELSAIKGTYSIKDSFVLPSPETKVRVYKDKAIASGLSVTDIALAAQTAVNGKVATKYKIGGDEFDIKVRLRPEDRKDMNIIRHLIIHSPLGLNVPLSEVAYIATGKGPTEIKHQDQQRVIFVTAYLYKRSLNSAMKEVEAKLKKMAIPANYSIKIGGEKVKMQESFNSLLFALLLSIILVYMIMASQFESLMQPFLILFTIPLSLIGVAIALFLTNVSMSVMVFLGAIVLGGIVVNNGIILIDCINRLKEEGEPMLDSITKACQMRFRPILMTAGTTILGLLPLAIGINEGAQLQVPMALTIMGGLTISTFLSLFVIPSLYLIFSRKPS